jgi:hypothetical protein
VKVASAIQLAFAPLLIGLSIYTLVKFGFRNPLVSKVMLISVIITQLGESALSVFNLFIEVGLGYMIALVSWMVLILLSLLTYQYFAFELQRVKTFIQSKDILDFKIRMKQIKIIKLIYVILLVLLITLILINFLEIKKTTNILEQTWFSIIFVRSVIVLIILLNIYIMLSSLFYFIKKKILTKHFKGKYLSAKERTYIGFVGAFAFSLCLYPVFFVIMLVLDFCNIKNWEELKLNEWQLIIFQCLLMDYRATNLLGSLMLICIFYNMS